LILEKNKIPGGCVTTFARKGFHFDTTQIIPDVSDLLTYFDIDIPLKKFDGYYARLFKADIQTKTAQIIPIPSSHKAFEEMLIERYPEDKKSIQRFFQYCLKMHQELNYLKTEPHLYQIPGILLHCKRILATSNLTFHDFLKKFQFKNPEVLSIIDTFSSFSGLSGDRCAALLTACAMITTLKGSFRPEKGFIQFPIALAKKIKESGIEIRTDCEVQKIITNNNQIEGVYLKTGEFITSEFVICTADTKVTYEKLLGLDVLKKANLGFYKKLSKVKMSPSGFSIQLGLDDQINLSDFGFNCGYNVLTSGPDAFEKMFKAWENNDLIQSDSCFHMAAICPSLLTGRKNTLVIHVVPVPAKYWIELKERNPEEYVKKKNDVALFYINKIEEYMIPELTKHILVTDISTPATYKNFIGTPTGSQYDMLPVPQNFGKNRIKTRTPIKGLFVPKFSHGIWPSMQAGLQVVDMISKGRIMNGNSSYRR
ncbi:MAG: hypothetical protein CVU05_03535, partial [Bacteroidetes bacterium HGW-Bacteroidetes-21]